MRRAALLLAALLAASSLGACSKCDVPTYQSQACTEKPSVR
jgi:outer membrane protein assembly factor BamE (lipoprotein component of BamABCDE complex)